MIDKRRKPARFKSCGLSNSGCVRQGRYSYRPLETKQQFNGSGAAKHGARFIFPRDLFMRSSRHDRFSKRAWTCSKRVLNVAAALALPGFASMGEVSHD